MTTSIYRPQMIAALVLAMCAPGATLSGEPSGSPDPVLLARHVACSETAAARGMGAGAALACAENYHRLKLSFLPDMDDARFRSLDRPSRLVVLRQGYEAYVAWTEGGAVGLSALEPRD